MRRTWCRPSTLPAFAVIGGTPQHFAELIRDGIERYGAIIKAAGIQPE